MFPPAKHDFNKVAQQAQSQIMVSYAAISMKNICDHYATAYSCIYRQKQ